MVVPVDGDSVAGKTATAFPRPNKTIAAH
jgi:hypothetical protein